MMAIAQVMTFVFFAAFYGAVGFLHIAAAQDATGTDVRRGMMQERRIEMRERVDERKEQTKAFATSTATSTRRGAALDKRGAMHTEMQERMERIRAEHQKKMDEHAARGETFRGQAETRLRALHKRVSEDRAKHIEEFFARMVERYERMTERFSDFADRIEAHIERLEDSGVNVTAAKTALEEARTRINEALTKLEAVQSGYSDFVDDTDLRRAFGQKVRETVKVLNAAMRETHQALIRAAETVRKTAGAEHPRRQETATSTED